MTVSPEPSGDTLVGGDTLIDGAAGPAGSPGSIIPPAPPTSFAALGVSPALCSALEAEGIVSPFPIQALTIANALLGRDVCGKAKTGSGKTLAFGLPLLQRLAVDPAAKDPRGLILVPTRELARQVADVLEPLAKAAGHRLTACYGGTAMEAQIAAVHAGTDLVVATPGRLIDLRQRGEVNLSAIEIMVLDEADRMADMGFMPQVEWLLRHLTSAHQTMLFSATLDGDVDRLVRNELTDPVRHEVISQQATVTEMEHRFLQVHQMDKVKVTAAICRHVRRAIVFSRTKRGADRLNENLRKEGIDARAIHGDLRQQMRERALKAFATGTLPVLVATDVAARGIDVDDVDVVIHYDPPEDAKSYLHRSGRTARAGRAGMVVTLVLWNEQLDVEKIQKRLGLSQPVVEIFSNDPRLADLRSWDPATVSVA
ncbi:MAG: DEAD/DEAH box helicase [Actinomycetota bacterium]|nr:DEAD/DEAH box helicase [Actinomycetota bacterium]